MDWSSLMQGGAEAARRSHTPEVGGSSPSPATNLVQQIHLAGAAYWGLVASYHLRELRTRWNDGRATKAHSLAGMAARHALSVLGRENDGSTAAGGLPGDPV